MKTDQQIKVLLSSLALNIIDERQVLIQRLANLPNVIAIAQTFGSPKLIRGLKLSNKVVNADLPELEYRQDRVFYQEQELGKIQILYKSVSYTHLTLPTNREV